jgi:hypothetical protein
MNWRACALRALSALCLLAGALTPASAIEQIVLDNQKIEQFIASYPVVAARIAQTDSTFDPSDTEALIDHLAELAKAPGHNPELDTMVQENGFASYLGWLDTGYSVLVARNWAESPPDMDEYREARAAIEALEGVSASDKLELIASLEVGLGMISSSQPPKVNVELIVPYLETLADTLEQIE